MFDDAFKFFEDQNLVEEKQQARRDFYKGDLQEKKLLA